jgi:Antitoxin VbhA
MSQKSDRISAEERDRRRAAVDHARASVGLEGFVLPPEEEVLALRYIDGEIELDEYLATPHRDLHAR